MIRMDERTVLLREMQVRKRKIQHVPETGGGTYIEKTFHIAREILQGEQDCVIGRFRYDPKLLHSL